MITEKELLRRQRAIRRNLRKAGLDGCLILDRANTLYATGFRCTSSHMLATLDEIYFITDFRYIEAARKEIPGCEVKLQRDPKRDLAKLIRRHVIRKLGVEKSMPYGLALEFGELFSGTDLIAGSSPVSEARLYKSRSEISLIQKAVHLTDLAYGSLAKNVKEGWTEIQVRNCLRRLIEKQGGEKESFDSIVATGKNASRPHAVAGDSIIRRGQVIQVDTGMVYENYCSDLSRVMSAGQPSENLRKLHRIVLDAQKRAIDAIKPGVKASDVDAKARDYIRKKGYGKRFGHGTGHGVGLEIHEGPTLRENSADILLEGMVVTVEPGIYLPGWGGVRIEDMVVVSRHGCEVLTKAPKEPAII